MKFTAIVFSPTGGTQMVVNELVAEWGEPADKVDLTDAMTDFDAITLEKDDVAVIAVPSYGGRVPSLAGERLAKIHGNQARCVLVCVYGNRAFEDTLIELNDIAERSGFKVSATVSAIAEHSIMHQYASGRPDRQDKEELHNISKKILEKLHNHTDCLEMIHIPGNRPYKKAGAVSLVPKANDKCTNCGLCAEICPAQAISKEDIRNTDGTKCISCMRCVSQCPQSARKVNSAIVSVVATAIKKACSERKNNELYIG